MYSPSSLMSLIKVVFSLFICLCWSCITKTPLNETEKTDISAQVEQMLTDYHQTINTHGLMAEFDFLDASEDFFWNPPGFSTTLSYDDVKSEVTKNATLYKAVYFRWDTLKIYPLSRYIADYTGIVSGKMTDTANRVVKVRMMESGTAIKREDGWKILNGQTTLLD